MENGKALHSGKNAEKRRSEALKRELLILVHDFLMDEGFFESADTLKDQIEPLLSQFKVADNIDLPLITTEFLNYYKMRFNKEPILVKKCENPVTNLPKRYENRFIDLKFILNGEKLR